jgi:molecular chaperone DnaK (HSP70)
MRRFAFLGALVLTLLGCGEEQPSPGTPENHSRVKYADSVLTESVGVETLGGVFTPVIAKGTRIPVTIKDRFSTATDNQPAVDVHVLAGNAKYAKDCRTIGRFQVDGIPRAPRGVPIIEICYQIDRQGNLTVTAKDLAAGNENQIKVIEFQPKPSD